ncbi:phosphoribosylaminoimidazolesuccinocarboxamide synthase [Candidatus Liberibacter solanacearum]|uniref:Phosphoribosylaminoimidazole-succinocarboxamide synthase n=1 Tax=Candidatus Liberibacter solanacearum TaxID=556287 RepID=A0A1V2N765_9HYPH|nr:phosphoribosylaminoimidazolesuccinocarboxamide synthase [Candidatus Liberibacter solanacearum]ONI58758.1 phosphoribosylaminoimidazolesuccinocarboxamide synthase [Candidatus Liberibacter solanacearum]ONI59407.1 phosphoribosylaminoimidazolesuccinocarboxamide synthase [Candidatus Liberibacter solanacearum]
MNNHPPRKPITRIISEAYIPELPNYYPGKVRENYFLNDGTRITIATDRLSAFDRNITCIPHKGELLNKITQYWFQHTSDICENHALDYPDPNVLVGKQLQMFPIELIVRGYLAGNTKTSLLTFYKKGQRTIYGHSLPDNMYDNQKLPHTIITPTTKSSGPNFEHDKPISPHEIIQKGILTQNQWETISSYALALFERGCKLASERDLILVDSKYEFGLDKKNNIILADEIHTPDSSRYWKAETYEKSLKEGTSPEGMDKDLIRNWILTHCNPYKDNIPNIPENILLHISQTYMTAYERITGLKFIGENSDLSPLHRIRNNLEQYINRCCT